MDTQSVTAPPTETPAPTLAAENPAGEVAQPPQPELLTPEKNELDKKAVNSSKAGLGQKIRNAGSIVFNQFGQPFKRNRGRPRLDGEPVKGSIPLGEGEPENQPANPPENPSPVSEAGNSNGAVLFREAVVSSVEGVLGILKDITRTLARACEIDEPFTEKALSRCDANGKKVERFQRSLDAVLKKHNVQPKSAEEIALVITGGELLSPFVMLLVEFRAEFARRRRHEERLAAAANPKKEGA